jgi:sulfur carrier protein
MRRTIQITVNGMTEEVPENATLEILIERFQEADPALIVELNGRYIYAREYSTTRVSQDDRVEFIHPDFGG